MATPQDRRKLRLQSDYREMENIKGRMVNWEVISGSPPFVEKYKLIVNVHTIISPQPQYRDTHMLELTLPPDYPVSAPQIKMLDSPKPYHPNWFTDHRWCYGTWDISEGLGHHVVRMIRTLQFDLEITNPNSPADRDANNWFTSNLNRNLFPCDRQVLPDPTEDKIKKKFSILAPPVKSFKIG